MKFVTSRRLARKRALQVLYSWQVSHNDLVEIASNFIVEHDMTGVNISYFHILCFGVVDNLYTLDDLMKPYLLRTFNELGYVELIILRIAIFEFVKCLDVPYKVIINEAIELAKVFAAEMSYKFVNGVLDKVANKVILTEKY
ncbi:transcription antitermination factor NusB [Blochmannia endosymbiont of Polyrhachis (Hedomyrma) turneri]|uniref:transcription antitermination factor NusB n=1 Tax=Blochmannia endosymbiont of Polyrhachis (Hedomyrma) turneri TaxID=1505596 RepID=UPI00061A7939|nr:transcription antitermination factor NusB [Blochmannia endosymbiont of Polyrhachis (Hedomyrma) turneri]AKC59806.1 N utilization substance protein B [Blochmannia endosymbiont of Polyrhachis (Hedomyrma) turneri]